MMTTYSNREINLGDLPQFDKVDYNPVSVKLRSRNLLGLLIVFLIFLTGVIIYSLNLPVSHFKIGVAAIIFIIFILGFINIYIKQTFYGFVVREHDIIYRRGYIITKVTTIPFKRIQHIAITRTFLDKIFGISSLKIYTAGGSKSDIGIPGLLPETADTLKDMLSKNVSADV